MSPRFPVFYPRLNNEQRTMLFTACCGSIALGIVAVYNLLFYNRYAPLPEGWFSVYADLLRKGELPYRDIYFFLPPIYPLFIAGTQAIFGIEIIVLRLVGLAIILICAGALFAILRECFSSAVALFSAVAGMIYYQSGVAHINYDFIQVMNMVGLLGGLCLLRFNRGFVRSMPTYSALWWAVGAGVCAALAVFTKQSNGFFIAIAISVGILLVGCQGDRRQKWRGSVHFCIGFGVIVGLLGFYLFVTGSFVPCIKMMFGGAASAKGGLGQVFFGFISTTLTGDLVSRSMAIFILGLPFGFGSFWLFEPQSRSPSKTRDSLLSVLAVTAGSAGLLAAILVPWARLGGILPWILELFSNYVTLSMIPAALLGTLLALAAWIVNANPRRRVHRSSPQFLVAIVSAGMLWGNGTSGGLSEGGAFLGFCLFLGLLLQHGGWFRLGAVSLAAVVCFQVAIYAEDKYRAPYRWWGVEEPDIRLLHVPANQPLLKGLWVTPERNAIYDQITSIIARETLPGEAMLVFPQTPIFYLLADRPMMGRAVVHWFDFLPDNLARKESLLLDKEPPVLILMMEMPEEVYVTHENLFRAGQPSGQREIVGKIHQLEKEDIYKEIALIPLHQNYSFRILKRTFLSKE